MQGLDAHIVGLGVVCPAGRGVDRLWHAVESGRSLMKPNDEGFVVGEISQPLRQEVQSDLESFSLYKTLQSKFHSSDVFDAQRLSLAAMEEALVQAGWGPLGPEDGFIMATTTGQIPVWEHDLMKYMCDQISPEELVRTFRQQSLAITMSQIIAAMGFRGRSTLVASACSASSQALVLAHKWMRQGLAKRVLVGSTELLCTLTLRGFNSFQLLASESARPFDKNRCGINLSEAAAFLCLEGSESSRSLARFVGGAVSSDAYHMTSPHPQGRGCSVAMERAMLMAGLLPTEIDWVHAHGTGSAHNDAAEGQAVQRLFGSKVPVTSTKGVHGHPLAASGALEAIIDVEAIKRQIIPGTATLLEPDDSLGIRIPQHNQPAALRAIMKNSLGFGGTNCSYVVCSHGRSRNA